MTQRQYSERDIDHLVRTVYGEAAGEGEAGWKAVAAVIRNRALRKNASLEDVVLEPGQFEPWMTEAGRERMRGIAPGSERYEAIRAAVLPLLEGKEDDPTGGATHFYAPRAQAALGRSTPRWAVGKQGLDIGNHRFYNLEVGALRRPQSRDEAPIQPVDLVTDYVERPQEQDQDDGPGFFEAIDLMIQEDWATAQLFKGGNPYGPDENFKWTDHEEEYTRLTQGLDESYLPKLDAAQSLKQAEWIRDQIQQSMEREQQLAKTGIAGAVGRFIVGMADPVGLAVGVVTGGAGAAAIKGRTLTAGLTRGAAIATADATAYNAIMSDSASYTEDDAIRTYAASIALGGLLGSIMGKGADDAVESTVNGIAQLSGRPEALRIRDDSVGAARTGSYYESIGNDTDARMPVLSDLRQDTDFAGMRASVAAQGKRSENDLTNVLTQHLVEDGVGSKDGSKVVFAVSEEAHRLSRVFETRYHNAMKPLYDEYARAKGWNWFDKMRDSNRAQFNREVASAVRRLGDPTADANSPVTKAAQAWSQWMDAYRKIAQDPGAIDGTARRSVPGFEDLDANPNYVPRIFDLAKMDAFLREFGDENFRRYLRANFAQQLKNLGRQIDDELLDKIVTGYARKLRGLKMGEDQGAMLALSGEDFDGLKTALLTHPDNTLTAKDIDDALGWLKNQKNEGGAPARGKKRLLLDETFEVEMRSTDGTKTQRFSMENILVDDLEVLAGAYNKQMSGRIALARLRIPNPDFDKGLSDEPWLIDGIFSPAQIDTLMNQVRRHGDAKGLSRQEIDRDVELLKWAFDRILGVPVKSEQGRAAEFFRWVRNLNFVRVMGQSGFAQIPEIVNVPAQLGLRAFMQNIPRLASMIRRTKAGELNDPFFKELEFYVGAGTDVRRMEMGGKSYDETGATEAYTGKSEAFQKLDSATLKARNAVAIGSGQAPITALFQRLAMGSVSQKFINGAFGRTGWNKRRLAQMGLDQKDLDEIFEQIRTHSKKVPSELNPGAKIRILNLDDWEPATRHKFVMATQRFTRRMIQENDIGQMHQWMSHAGVKTILQFRTFMIGAWEKQLLSNMNVGGFAAFTTFALQYFMSLNVYVAQTALMAQGRSDKEEYLADRLSMERLPLAAFQRTGWSSLLPTAIDSALPLLGQEKLFDYRTTGSSSDLVLGNPTTGLIDDIPKAFGGAIDIATGEGDQNDARAIKRLLPFQNVIPIALLFDAMISPMDEPKRQSR